MRPSFSKIVRGPLSVLLATGVLCAWLVSSPASAAMLFQSSPQSPLPTSTPTPLTEAAITSTPIPVATLVAPTQTPIPTATTQPTATETIEAATLLPTQTAEATLTPEEILLPPGPADPTPVPTPTATVDLAGMLMPLAIPTLRPVTVPTPTLAPDRLLVAARLIDRAVGSLAWLWLICGSFIFFVVAGIVVGLGVTGRVADRRSQPTYGGYADSGFHPYLDTPPTNPGRTPYTPQDDDNWPASLP